MKNSRKKTIVIVLAVISIILVSNGYLIRMSILPSEEGLNTGIYGFGESLYGEVYSAKNPPVTPVPGEEGYELLNDDEKGLFTRLAVFRGGFTLDHAQQILHQDGVTKKRTLNHLSRLVDKSLVYFHTDNVYSRYFKCINSICT